MSEYKPKVVCFSCKFSWGYLVEESSLSAKIKNWIPIICTGKVDTTHILDAFEQGADGVLILGCPEGDCHYQDGNYEARKKVYLVRKLLDSYGIESERVKLILSVDPDGSKIPLFINDYSREISKLGPVKKIPVVKKTLNEPAMVKGGK